jgi:hypothetical protein
MGSQIDAVLRKMVVIVHLSFLHLQGSSSTLEQIVVELNSRLLNRNSLFYQGFLFYKMLHRAMADCLWQQQQAIPWLLTQPDSR